MIKETEYTNIQTTLSYRYLSIDVFKGLTVLLMVFANTFSPFENVPAWTQHAGDFGLTYVDLVAVFFVFMIALNFKLSFTRRLETKGKKSTYLRFIRRYLIFIGLGLILTMYVDLGGFYFRWGTLQILGFAGLILLFLIKLKASIRFIISLLMLVVHQILLITPLSANIYNSIEGGILAMFSWTAMILLSSCIADGLLMEKVKEYFLYGGIILTIAGVFTSFFIPFSRTYITASYTIISVGISALLYYMIHFVFEVSARKKAILKKERFFSVVGKNAFLLYLIDFIIAYSIYSILPWDAPVIIVFIVAFISVFSIWLIAYLMDRAKMYIII